MRIIAPPLLPPLACVLVLALTVCGQASDSPRTPTANPDLERKAIIDFTRQALEIEAKRNELIAYFAGLQDKVGIHGQAFAIERYFSRGVPTTLRDASPPGIEGISSLINRLRLLDSPQSLLSIKDALVHIYDSEIQQAQIQSENQVDWGDPIRIFGIPRNHQR